MNVLVAEDDTITRLMVQKAIESLGHKVTAVCDGANGLQALDAGTYRFIVSDWLMPNMDGLEFCRQIRARPDGTYTYVVLLTAKTMKEDRLLAMKAGVDDFLSKPIDREELEACMRVGQRIIAKQEELENQRLQLESLYREAQEKNSQLSALAATDGLTGLKNHRHFVDALEKACAFAHRSTAPISVVMMDVDSFKRYNDNFGHLAGNEVLKTVADIILRSARTYDLAARYGGEEFVLLCPGTDAEGAKAVGERIRKAVESYEWPHGPVTISVGLATQTNELKTAAELTDEADHALYHSKRNGKNQVSHSCELSSVALSEVG